MLEVCRGETGSRGRTKRRRVEDTDRGKGNRTFKEDHATEWQTNLRRKDGKGNLGYHNKFQ